jgi:hypothetical protein
VQNAEMERAERLNGGAAKREVKIDLAALERVPSRESFKRRI